MCEKLFRLPQKFHSSPIHQSTTSPRVLCHLFDSFTSSLERTLKKCVTRIKVTRRSRKREKKFQKSDEEEFSFVVKKSERKSRKAESEIEFEGKECSHSLLT
jgi:ribosome-associated translation inhibitor RaiA